MSTRSYLTEFIGTFFLVLTIGLCIQGSATNTPFVPMAIGSSLMIMVYMGGHISGAHYNPAVSLAVLLRGKMAGRDFIPYVLAQCLGAFVAALTVYYLLGKTFAPAPAAGVPAVKAILVEALYTFALALVVLNTATSPKTEGNSYFGLAIGFTVVVGAVAGGGISGGAFNCAVGIGPILVDSLIGNGSMANLWIYLVGPLAGGALAAIVYHIQHGTMPTQIATPATPRGAAAH